MDVEELTPMAGQTFEEFNGDPLPLIKQIADTQEHIDFAQNMHPESIHTFIRKIDNEPCGFNMLTDTKCGLRWRAIRKYKEEESYIAWSKSIIEYLVGVKNKLQKPIYFELTEYNADLGKFVRENDGTIFCKNGKFIYVLDYNKTYIFPKKLISPM